MPNSLASINSKGSFCEGYGETVWKKIITNIFQCIKIETQMQMNTQSLWKDEKYKGRYNFYIK